MACPANSTGVYEDFLAAADPERAGKPGKLAGASIDQFIEQSPRVARRIDLDGDGHLSRREVSVAKIESSK